MLMVKMPSNSSDTNYEAYEAVRESNDHFFHTFLEPSQGKKLFSKETEYRYAKKPSTKIKQQEALNYTF